MRVNICYWACALFCVAYLFTTFAIGNVVIDLSHPFTNRTIYWPGFKHFTLTNVVRGVVQPAGIWLEHNNFEANEHGGTHMDAPAHFVEGRWKIDDIPVDRFICPAVVIDIVGKAEANNEYQLTVGDIMAWEERYGRIPDGAIVFMFTNWSVRWPDQERYLGNARQDVTDLHYPGFSIEAAHWLTENRLIYGVAVDTPSPDYGPSPDFPVHIHLLGLNLFSIENVNNLDKVPPSGATVYAFPMKIAGGSGGPCRLIAVIPEENPQPSDQNSGPKPSTLSFFLMLVTFIIVSIGI